MDEGELFVCLDDDDIWDSLPKFREGFPFKASKWKEDRYYLLDQPRQIKEMALKAEGYETKSEKGLFGVGATLYYRRPWWYPFDDLR